ncbi:MAG: hypothetical protein H7145_23955 [Akkermansiaceae bacterium]|nr:hypothetical protein [Armatimonadota bacterium]
MRYNGVSQPAGGSAFLEQLSPFHQLLISASLFGPTQTDLAPPRISRRSSHYRFALLVVAGYSYDESCCQLAINPRTAERWRTCLRKQAAGYFGRAVTYEYAARVALDGELRRLCESVRGTPQPAAENPCTVVNRAE